MPQSPKAPLRDRFLAMRRARAAADVDDARAAVAGHVLDRAHAAGWSCVAAYEPLRTEPGSLALLAGLRDAGVRVLVPLTRPDRDLDWTEWTPQRRSDPLAVHDDGGLGPEVLGEADAVLVPALAVALDGTRLGRGGGSYDRALPRARPGAVVAALLFDGEVCEHLPAQEWDVPVAAVVTPQGWRDLPGRTGDAPAR